VPRAFWAGPSTTVASNVIKFTDTALRSYRRTADPAALTASVTAVQLGA